MTDYGENNKHRCRGETKAGSRCTRRIVKYDYCHVHRNQGKGSLIDSMSRQQRLFIEFYLANGFNQTKAAADAGYSTKNIHQSAAAIMAHPNVKQIIEERLSDYSASANETLARLAEFSRATISHFVDESGYLDLSSDFAQAHAQQIQEIRYNKHGQPESIKLVDAKDAVKTLVKVHGLSVDRVEHSGSVEQRQAPEYDLSVLDDDELAELERITAKLEAAEEGTDDE